MSSQAFSINAANRLSQSRLQTRLQQEQQQQQDPSRLQNFQVIELPNGMKKYRLMGVRTVSGGDDDGSSSESFIHLVHKGDHRRLLVGE
jgi:hypothetical protein